MKLIADSGSTNTRWHLLTNTADGSMNCRTAGINPFFQTISDIKNTLENEFVLDKSGVSSVYFYGAGITDESKKRLLQKALNEFFNVDLIFVESDLMAAARALCGEREGIAAILGTGSNSCYYDGSRIVQNVSPLGYILGDEGSGAVLGRTLVADILKNQFPQNLTKRFFETYNTNKAEILENVYKKPFPNRYLAGYTKFLLSNIHEEAVIDLIVDGFEKFFKRNIEQYPQARKHKIHFTGSVAWYFSDLLKVAAAKSGFETGVITIDPMERLLAYHEKC